MFSEVKSAALKSALKGKGVRGWMPTCYAHWTVRCPRPEVHCPTVDSCVSDSPASVIHITLIFFSPHHWPGWFSTTLSPQERPSSREWQHQSFQQATTFVYVLVTKPSSSHINCDGSREGGMVVVSSMKSIHRGDRSSLLHVLSRVSDQKTPLCSDGRGRTTDFVI